jgi:hypothetical protein
MKIGITGTRSGMTEHQKQVIARFLQNSWVEGAEFHHGDCVGVDVEAADIAKMMRYKIVSHPPAKNDLRAFHKSDEFRKPGTYFARNRTLVDEADVVLVVPFQMSHQPTGGTWYTHDYAVKKDKPVHIIYPEST